MLNEKIARELARINLPLSLYTEWYWQIDLNNLFHFLHLRMDPHAQKEIRDYALVMYNITQAVCPLAVAAFDEHVRCAIRFSKSEMDALRRILMGESISFEEKAYNQLIRKLGCIPKSIHAG
jgi:thymidylate synthase (FAD)